MMQRVQPRVKDGVKLPLNISESSTSWKGHYGMHNIVAEEGKRVYCGGSSKQHYVTGMPKSRAYVLDRIAK
jgi:hypothetical protein